MRKSSWKTLEKTIEMLLNLYRVEEFNYALTVASRNGLLEEFCRKLRDERARKILDRSNRILSRQLEAIKEIDESEVDYVLIKSLRPYRHVSEDIDILARNSEEFRKFLLDMGFRPMNQEAFTDGTIRIDLYDSLRWQHYEAISVNRILSKAIRRKFRKMEVTIPYPVDQILIIFSHSINHDQLSLGELLWIEHLLYKADEAELWREAEACGLLGSFRLFASIADIAYGSLYGKSLFNSNPSLLLEANSKITGFADRCKSVENYPLFYPLLPTLHVYFDKVSFNMKHGLWTFFPKGIPKFLVKRIYNELGELYRGWKWRRSA